MTSEDVDRWRPSRAGLVALWRFWEETFVFHAGRLLLRGPNGAGKSLALELLLPFLLDADSSPHRLTSAAKSRGGLYDRIMTGSGEATRTGFAWVEFTRGDDVFTVGVRLRTSTATHKVDPAYFTTSQRVGTELRLLNHDRVPLSRLDLEAAIGDRGRVHRNGEEHRDAVREALFPGFSRDRYASVVTALLALRKEKLSQNLDLAKLSEVLSESLAPLDEQDLAAVAEGFQRLDRRRAELEQLAREVREVDLLASRQRDYARAVLRAVTADVRSAETRRDDVTRAEREARSALEQAEQSLAELTQESEAVEQRLGALGVERDALQDTDAYRAGSGLADLRTLVRQLQERTDLDRAAADRNRAAAAKAEQALRQALTAEDQSRAGYQDAWDELDRRSTEIGAEAATGDLAPTAETPVPPPARVRESARLLDAWVGRRRAQLQEVRRASAQHDEAVRERNSAQGRLDEDEATLAERSAAETAAGTALDAAVEVFAAAVQTWLASLTALDPAVTAAALPVPLCAPEPVQAALQGVAAEARSAHEMAMAGIVARRDVVEAEHEEVTAERDRLAAGRDVEPMAPAWRTDRSQRAGAPLWRLVEVGDHVPAATVQGLESALTAAGLVDAWVRPDGDLDLDDQHADLTLTREPLEGENLGDWLVPLADAPVPADVMAGVLRSVRTAASAVTDGDRQTRDEVVLGRDGSFRLGAAVGHGPDEPGTLLGAEARRRRRVARLAELETELRRLRDRLAELDRDRTRAEQRRAAVLAELAEAPDGRTVITARSALATARVRSTEAAERLARSRERVDAAQQVVRERSRRLTAVSAQHALPTQQEALSEVETALMAFTGCVQTWRHRAEHLEQAVVHHEGCAERAGETQEQVTTAVLAVTRGAAALDDASGRLATLERSVGAEYAEILARLEELVRLRAGTDQRRRELTREVPAAARSIGRLTTTLNAAESDRATAEKHRANVVQRLTAAFRDGLTLDAQLPVTVPESVGGVTAALEASRELSSALGSATTGTDLERANSRVQDGLHQAQEAIGGRSDLDRRLTDHGWWVLSAVVGGLRRGVTQLRSALEQEVESGRQEFAAEEERLFEQVLAGSVRRALASRIRMASKLVADINTQLDQVRTSAGGVGVRLRWDVDPDQLTAVKSARALLLRDPDDLGEAEAAALQEFVRARVEQARAELDPTASWEARLTESLDYRSWHRFSLQIAHRDWDGYKDATPSVLQRLSTGERSIALHLPMMASVAAHYTDERGAPAGCPRLILLDELFAGVDPANRAQLFGTFTAWELDAVLTSDHEWCQYASLDGIAVHHLHPAQDGEPVTTTRFTWDGRQRRLDPVP